MGWDAPSALIFPKYGCLDAAFQYLLCTGSWLSVEVHLKPGSITAHASANFMESQHGLGQKGP